MQYLSHKDFFSLYPKEFKIADGAYGKVYSSNEYVIKKFNSDPSHLDFCIELNIYASINHPCIVKPVAWTVKNFHAYLAMEKGQKIYDAFIEGRIKIDQIICDVLSAVEFLNSNGIAHCDIKPGNIIFSEGRVKLIDMGICKYAELHTDGQYYIDNTAYSPSYRDPEYYMYQYNNIKCEITSIILTCYALINRQCPTFGVLYDYKAEPSWFFEQGNKPTEKKDTITQLTKNLPIKYNGSINHPNEVKQKMSDKIRSLIYAILKFCLNNNIKARCLFLCLHLIRRTCNEITFLDDINLQLYGFVMLDLAINIIDQGNTFGVTCWKKFIVFKDEEYQDLTIKILRLTNGILFSETYWDYARSGEDLRDLVFDTIDINYDPKIIRDLQTGSNKSIYVRDFLCENDLKLINMKRDYQTNISKMNSCNLDLESADMTKINQDNILNYILRNRKTMDKQEMINYVSNFSDLPNKASILLKLI